MERRTFLASAAAAATAMALDPAKADTLPLGNLPNWRYPDAGVGQFGSGWCWLQVKTGKLEVSKTPNGENPLVHGATPILGSNSSTRSSNTGSAMPRSSGSPPVSGGPRARSISATADFWCGAIFPTIA